MANVEFRRTYQADYPYISRVAIPLARGWDLFDLTQFPVATDAMYWCVDLYKGDPDRGTQFLEVVKPAKLTVRPIIGPNQYRELLTSHGIPLPPSGSQRWDNGDGKPIFVAGANMVTHAQVPQNSAIEQRRLINTYRRRILPDERDDFRIMGPPEEAVNSLVAQGFPRISLLHPRVKERQSTVGSTRIVRRSLNAAKELIGVNEYPPDGQLIVAMRTEKANASSNLRKDEGPLTV